MVYFQHRMDQCSVKGQYSRLRGLKVAKTESLGRFKLVALLLVGYVLPVAAQSFNLRIDPFGQSYGETAFSVELGEDGNYVVIASVPFNDGQLYYSAVVTSIVVSPQGQVLQTERVDYPSHVTYPGWSNSSAKRNDGGFVVGGNTYGVDSSGNNVSRAALFMVAASGSIEEFYEVGPTGQSWIGRQAKQTPDGGYVICGESSGDAFVIKTDAQGNEEWVRTYGGQWNDYCKSVEPATGGGYYIGGQNTISSNNIQVWITALNDTGGVAWTRTWGGSYHDLSAHVVEMADGHVLASSSLGYGTFGPYRAYLAKLDASDGSFIWQREYGASGDHDIIRSAHEIAPFGDLISVGYTQVPGVGYFGSLLRTTNTGDSLWMRNYQYHDSIVSNAPGLFHDVQPTPDGGFVAVGSALNGPATNPYTQDVWVVKVDSMGCLEPGCHLITGMETQITNLRDVLKVYPNPVASGGSVTVTLELPQTFKPQGPLQLTVVDALGRLVSKENFTPNNSQLTLHTSTLPSGLYHLHLSDNTRWISGCKLVVELQ